MLSVVVASSACFPFSSQKASYKLPENTSSGVSRFHFEKNLLSCCNKRLIFLLWRSQGALVPNTKSVYSLHSCLGLWANVPNGIYYFLLIENTESSLSCIQLSTLWYKCLNYIFDPKKGECTLLSPSQLMFCTCFAKLPFKFFFLFCWGSCSLVTLSRCSVWPCKLKTDAQESCLFKNKSLMRRTRK